MDPLLSVSGLRVSYPAGNGTAARVVDGVSFEVKEGEVVGILGESGCGKTTTALAILRLLPASAAVEGSVRFRSRELLVLPERDFQPLRGASISVVFQEPGTALNPVMRAGTQVAEVIRAHRRAKRRRCQAEALAALRRAGFDDPEAIARAYPHELSGGERQRVALAQALACSPPLVIADEPTGALDAVTRAQVFATLSRMQRELGMALVLISHNPAVLLAMAHRILVMYAGRIVESGAAAEVAAGPLHPYTRALLRCSRPAGPRHFEAIEGAPPDPTRLPAGCPFSPRCAERRPECTLRVPEPVQAAPSRSVRCWVYGG